MTKLIKISGYWINPANIAYLSSAWSNTGQNRTDINFNAYAAAANEMQSAFEPLSVTVDGTPDEIAALINPPEPAF